MRRTLKIFFTAAALVFLSAAAPAFASSTLSDLRDQLAQYQTEPRVRAHELETELAKIRDVEEGLARQYDVKVSDVIRYEFQLEWLIDTYHSLYMLQKRGDARNTFLLDNTGISQLAQKKPPYSFAFYLRVINELSGYTREYKSAVGSVEFADKQILEMRSTKQDVEREYRLTREKSLLSTENRVRYNFDLLVLRARLERTIADYTFYEYSRKLAEAKAADTKSKIDVLNALLKNTKGNIKTGDDIFAYIDSIAFTKSRRLNDNIARLEKKFDAISKIRRETVRPSPFAKYWMLTEQDLLEDEILFNLDVIESWAAVRVGWRSLEELSSGRLTVSEQKALRTRTEALMEDTTDNIYRANKTLQKFRAAAEEVERRFSDADDSETMEDDGIKDEFLNDLEEGKQRYLEYIITLGTMNTQFETLKQEIDRQLGEANTKDKISDLIGENTASIADYELWSFGDYPITVRKFVLSLIIFIIGLSCTKLIISYIRRRYRSHPSMTPHSSLLVQKFVFYIGLIVSFLTALWMLHIPLTAFAFMGGAAAIAIGLGTQKMMGDTLSGILLLFQKKVRIGDDVIIDGVEGIVTDVTLQNTVLLCEQSKYMIIPNSKVLESSVLNLTVNGSQLRTQVSVTVAGDSDIGLVSKVIESVLSCDKFVLKKPPFRIVYNDAGEEGIQVKVIFFMDNKKSFETDAQSEVRIEILKAFREHGIKFPTKRRDVRVVQ